MSLIIGEKILKFFLPEGESESVSGDYEELYTEAVLAKGKIKALIWFGVQIIKSIWTGISIYVWWSFAMLKSYLIIAFRHLKRNKIYALINIGGLAIGLSVVLFIFLFIRYEQSYDRFHAHAERIYRLNTKVVIDDSEAVDAVAAPGVAPALHASFPEIEKTTRFFKEHDPFTVRAGDRAFCEKRFVYVDPEFFDIFSFPLVKGDPKTVLSQPHSLVVTQEMARKYFPGEDAVGKTLTVNDGREDKDYIISGIAADVPVSSHFYFDFLTSFSDHELSHVDNWFFRACRTYLLLHKGASPEGLESKFPPLIEKGAASAFGGIHAFKDWVEEGNTFELFLQPLVDIHLRSRGIGAQIEPNGDILYVTLFTFIGLFVLLIAIFNFVNMATAQSIKRANEIGVRKVLGSSRYQLVRQFLTESVFFSLMAFIFSFGLVLLFLPALNALIDRRMSAAYLLAWPVFPGLVLFMIVVGVLAGIYPAFCLAAFNPVKVLRGKFDISRRSRLRSGLVVFQFSLSILLIIVTLLVKSQLHYTQAKDLGFDKEHILSLPASPSILTRYETFLAELRESPDILDVSLTAYLPGRPIPKEEFYPAAGPERVKVGLDLLAGDEDFDDTLGLQVVEGRFFSRKFVSDGSALVINQAAAKKMTEAFGWKSSLDKIVTNGRETYSIIGILEDFHFESLHKEIAPLAIMKLEPQHGPFLAFRVSPGNFSKAKAVLTKKWETFAPQQPFELVSFVNEVEKLYQSEQRTSRMMSLFSLLAVGLGCLGLFGLAAFTAEQKTKEIGIRKVFGATDIGLMGMLLKQFSLWVLAANIIAWPVAFYVITRWLENFAYRTNIHPVLFLASGAIVFVLAILTVGSHAWRAASSNPADSLRYE